LVGAQAGQQPGSNLVRDTTKRTGATLSVPAAAWRRFTDALR
jgi:hypothetical protein